MGVYKKNDLVISPKLSNVSLIGDVSELMEKFIYNRVTSDFAANVVYKEAEDAFRNCIDDETIVGYWQGEFWGKWIISAVRVCRYNEDEKLKSFIGKCVQTMISFQREDGYIGTYKNSLNVFKSDVTESRKVVGFDCDWNWNVWCRKYTLWALIECYTLLNDQSILEAAERLASHLIDELNDNNIRLCDTGVFNGLPSGSIIKPMVILYELTGNMKYLDFSVEAAESWDNPDGQMPNLIKNALSNKPIHMWYPNSEKWAKAYELMSCLDGLLELYRVTGVAKYYNAVESLYGLIDTHEGNILFSVGYNDIFANANVLINSISEPCDVIHWMRISYELFKLTGKRLYMDNFEFAFYNSFLASVYSDGNWGARGVRSAGRHLTCAVQAGMKHNHCCVNNIPRGFMNMAEAIVMYNNGLYINLFEQAQISISPSEQEIVKVDIGEGYLENCKVVIQVDADIVHDKELHIRIPGWSTNTSIRINGETHSAITSEYFTTKISAGKTIIEVTFDDSAVICEFPFTTQVYDQNDWHSLRWTDSETSVNSFVPYSNMTTVKKCTIRRGPLLLARSKRIGNTAAEMFEASTISGKNYTCTVKPIKIENVRCGFEAEFNSPSNSFKTLLCDYASAGNEWLSDDSYFNIFV